MNYQSLYNILKNSAVITEDPCMQKLKQLAHTVNEDSQAAFSAVENIATVLTDYRLNSGEMDHAQLKEALDDLEWDIDDAKDHLKFVTHMGLRKELRQIMENCIKDYKQFLSTKKASVNKYASCGGCSGCSCDTEEPIAKQAKAYFIDFITQKGKAKPANHHFVINDKSGSPTINLSGTIEHGSDLSFTAKEAKKLIAVLKRQLGEDETKTASDDTFKYAADDTFKPENPRRVLRAALIMAKKQQQGWEGKSMFHLIKNYFTNYPAQLNKIVNSKEVMDVAEENFAQFDNSTDAVADALLEHMSATFLGVDL